MNGKKIILITTLVASIILISATMIFARFVLQIDFTGDTQPKQEVSERPADEQPTAEQPETAGQEQQENPQTQINEEQQEQEEQKEEEEPTEFSTTATIKQATITVGEEDDAQKQTLGATDSSLTQQEQQQQQQEDQKKLTELLTDLNALQLSSVQQSVGLQGATWEASLNLSMSDGTALSVQLYDSNISGSKATLSTGSTTYESTQPVATIRTLLEGWMEEQQQESASKIAENEFDQASRMPVLDLDTMEVQDIAASKSAVQQALGKLKITDTLTGSIHTGAQNQSPAMLNLSDDTSTLFTFEFYDTGILAYSSENNKTFYVCEQQSLDTFYQTIRQLSAQYSSTPASLALMDFGALDSMTISSNTGTSRKQVGLIRDHAQTLFTFLQQIHVSKNNVKTESVMFSKPEYHADIQFVSGMVMHLDINSGSLLIDGGDGNILHYVMVGDQNLELVRAEFERLTSD